MLTTDLMGMFIWVFWSFDIRFLLIFVFLLNIHQFTNSFIFLALCGISRKPRTDRGEYVKETNKSLHDCLQWCETKKIEKGSDWHTCAWGGQISQSCYIHRQVSWTDDPEFLAYSLVWWRYLLFNLGGYRVTWGTYDFIHFPSFCFSCVIFVTRSQLSTINLNWNVLL